MQAGKHFAYLLFACILMYSCDAGMDLRKADKLYGFGEYNAAAIQYGRAYRRLGSNEKPLRAHAAYYRGECLRLLNQPIKAENEYRKAIRYKIASDTVYFRLAQTLHKNAKYSEAEKNYRLFLQNHPDDTLSLNGTYSCHRIAEWSEKIPKYQVRKAAELNSRKGDFSPVLVPPEYNTLIFTSSAKVKKDQKPSRITGLPDNDFWTSTLDVNGKWQKPEYIEGQINSEFDEGAASFSPDGKTMYFTRCVTKSDSIASSSRAEIFSSVRSGKDWGEPDKVKVYRDSTFIYAHPAVSPDGRYLYFVSDMKGGYGGKDIWRCEISDKTIGPPENLGPDINTAGDEMFPSFRENGEFYFSSNGLPGFGGLDIFKAVGTPDSGYVVENMLQSINSNGDDFGITFSGKENKGFFSSNRKEPKGWDKLWYFNVKEPKTTVSGNVTDRYGEILPDATIKIIGSNGLNMRTRSDKEGKYSINIDKGADYVMMGSARAYLNYSNRFYAIQTEKDTTYNADFILTPLHRPVRIENIFFEFNKATLMPESSAALNELVKLLRDNPHITVEISAHTDRVGTDEYNIMLSGMRANAVVDYLTQQGIEKERLYPKGYGKSMPARIDSYMEEKYGFLKENTILNEEYINSLPEQQQEICDQINRRCEFKVLKTTYKLF